MKLMRQCARLPRHSSPASSMYSTLDVLVALHAIFAANNMDIRPSTNGPTFGSEQILGTRLALEHSKVTSRRILVQRVCHLRSSPSKQGQDISTAIVNIHSAVGINTSTFSPATQQGHFQDHVSSIDSYNWRWHSRSSISFFPPALPSSSIATSFHNNRGTTCRR